MSAGAAGQRGGGAAAFALIYFTFFLDNVLLTVLVPIVPDWVRGEALALWARHEAAAPLAALLNSTRGGGAAPAPVGAGAGAAVVGAVLGAKAAAQLVTAPLAAGAVCRRGATPVLRAATALLAGAALVFSGCSWWWVGAAGGDGGAAWCAGAGRALHGAGAALGGVAGLTLAAAALPPARRDRAIGALLGAVALGVLVGYPFGGAAYALWSREAPFLLLAAALLTDLALQYTLLDNEELDRLTAVAEVRATGGCGGWREAAPAGACAGAVLLTTSVMAALEPCLPLWIMEKFHPQRWQAGVVFVPDSVGYLLATSGLGGVSRVAGAERVALTGQVAVGVAALCVPLARSVWGLALPHAALGVGLGACDAALVPALLARRAARAPALAALLQVAGSAAYALGPAVGGALAAIFGFDTAMRALGVLNLLYAAHLYRALTAHPLSKQWGASTPEPELRDSRAEEGAEMTPLQRMAPAPRTEHTPSSHGAVLTTSVPTHNMTFLSK